MYGLQIVHQRKTRLNPREKGNTDKEKDIIIGYKAFWKFWEDNVCMKVGRWAAERNYSRDYVAGHQY